MAIKELDTILKEPYDPTDPVVIFDPEIFPAVIAKEYVGTLEGTGINIDSLKKNSTRPIIQLGNIVLQDYEISQMTILYNDFIPTVKLSVSDIEHKFQALNVPGMNNHLNIVLVPNVEGIMKKISLEFYITKCEFGLGGESIYIEASYKLDALEKIQFKQIGSEELSSYETLQEIAKELKLGFAATENCESFDDPNSIDKRYRLIYGEKYKDYIKDMISYAGADESSVFDCWIDLYNYIVMVNLSYLSTVQIEPEQLTFYTTVGAPNNLLPNQEENTSYRVPRLLTNSAEVECAANCKIAFYKSKVNNNSVYDDGTLQHLWFMNDPGNTNTIGSIDISMSENSADGDVTEHYEYETMKFIGVDQDDKPLKLQRFIADKFKKKNNAKQLYICLSTPNYMLQRGTLVNVEIAEQSSKLKQIIKLNSENVTSPNTNDPIAEAEPDLAIDNKDISISNPALSGMYYIQGMEFVYSNGDENIHQGLYMYKIGSKTNILNDATTTKSVGTHF